MESYFCRVLVASDKFWARTLRMKNMEILSDIVWPRWEFGADSAPCERGLGGWRLAGCLCAGLVHMRRCLARAVVCRPLVYVPSHPRS